MSEETDNAYSDYFKEISLQYSANFSDAVVLKKLQYHYECVHLRK